MAAPITDCETCGQVHPNGCKGHVKLERGGRRPCCKKPMVGQGVCGSHGGKAPQNKAAAARRVEAERINGAVGKLLTEVGLEPAPDMLASLQQAHVRAVLTVRALAILVGQRDDVLGINRFGESVVHPLVSLHGEWLDRQARIAKLGLDAGISERQQRLLESELDEIFEAVNGALADIGMTPEAQEAFGVAIANRLRSAGP